MMDLVSTVIIISYFAFMLAIGVHIFRRTKWTSEEFFVAGRNLGPVLLFFTMAATNFSAFFFFGFAGASYTIGYAYYGMMAFGTAFTCINFYIIGDRVWHLGRRFSFVTPPELIGKRFDSKLARALFMIVMVVFTVPYIAVQPIGGGIVLSSLSDGAISYELGAVLITIVIIVYVFLGGMRGDAITDFAQGVLMLLCMLVALFAIAFSLGGFEHANTEAYTTMPELFSREGKGGFFTPQIWISYLLLWTFSNPMFPQLFVRFYAAKSIDAIKKTAVLYPLLTAVLFACPVIIGVWGNLSFPSLGKSAADNIIVKMLDKHAPESLVTLLLTGGFAALMSTADSQLLVSSSMLTRDLFEIIGKKLKPNMEMLLGRLFVVFLALVSLAFALSKQGLMLNYLTASSFAGLAVLYPATIGALYWKRANWQGCVTSILCGEGTLIFISMNSNPSLTLGFLPAIPSILVATIGLILGSYAFPKMENKKIKEFFKVFEGVRKEKIENKKENRKEREKEKIEIEHGIKP